MHRGAWIEQRDAPNTRAIVKSISRARHTPKVGLYLSGSDGVITYDIRELEELWELMQFEEDETVPYWCHKGRLFRPVEGPHLMLGERRAQAIIQDVRPGWVAYHDSWAAWRDRRFMMMKWWQFRKDWEPVEPPTAWGRVLHLED